MSSQRIVSDAVEELTSTHRRDDNTSVREEGGNPDVPRKAEQEQYRRFVASRLPSKPTHETHLLRDWVQRWGQDEIDGDL
jgi:hypothetical protein